MSSGPADQTTPVDSSDGNAAFVDDLVAVDEQLRRGEIASVHESRVATKCPVELLGCLELVERIWPRHGVIDSAAELPAQISRFQIHRLLGAGGFGIVYLASDPLLDRQVALKVPRLHTLANERLLKRFRREAMAAAAFDHPNVVPIYETGIDGPISYLVSGYCEGPSLAQWFQQQAAPVPCRVAAQIIEQLAAAMHFCHERGVLHRDLKPSNILLFPQPVGHTADPFPYLPRITDFGLARVIEEESEATGSSAVIGTPMYMAPEQALGAAHRVDARADVYSLGAILYELLCGRPPFTGAMPLEVLDQVRRSDPLALRRLRSDIPVDLETICLRCLQKRPQDRYASAQALAEDLRRWLQGASVAARPVSWVEQAQAWCRQPDRLRDAGWIIVAVNALIGCQLVLTVLMAVLGVIPAPADSHTLHPLAGALGSAFTMHLPLAIVGFYVMAAKRWAIVVSFWSGVVMSLAGLLLAGQPSRGSLQWDDLPGFRVVYGVIVMLCLLQTFASAIAWFAWREQKR